MYALAVYILINLSAITLFTCTMTDKEGAEGVLEAFSTVLKCSFFGLIFTIVFMLDIIFSSEA